MKEFWIWLPKPRGARRVPFLCKEVNPSCPNDVPSVTSPHLYEDKPLRVREAGQLVKPGMSCEAGSINLMLRDGTAVYIPAGS